MSNSIKFLLIFCFTSLVLLYDLFLNFQDSFMLIGGLHPYSDARGFWESSLLFFDINKVTAWGGRRPFVSLYFASLISYFGENLRAVQFLNILFCSFAISSITVIGYRYASYLGSALIYAVAMIFFKKCIQALIVSECFGFFLGSFSVVLFIKSLQTLKRSYIISSLLTLSFALAVRPGPLLILPVLVMFYAEIERKSLKQFAKNVLLYSLVVCLPFILSSISTKTLSNTKQFPFANLTHTLYGLAKGGVGWGSAYEDHPEFKKNNVPEPIIAKILFEKSLNLVKNNPLNLIKGVGVTYIQTIRYGGVFYLKDNLLFLNQLIPISLLFSAFLCLFDNRSIYQKFLSSCSIGILLSLPASTDGGIRVMASIVPILSLILIEPFVLFLPSRENVIPKSSIKIIYLNILLLFILFLGASFSFFKQKKDISRYNCETNEVLVKVNYGSQSIISDKSKVNGYTVSKSNWSNSIVQDKWGKGIPSMLAAIPKNSRVFSSYDYINKNLIWLISSKDFKPTEDNFSCVKCSKKGDRFCFVE